MTTLADRGGTAVTRVSCLLPPDRDGFLPLELALRDMRDANGRDPDTGARLGNRSWIGACLGMIVLDTLSGTTTPVWKRFKDLLTGLDIDQDDADILYSIRCSLLHGYGLPRPEDVGERNVAFTNDPNAYALDTSDPNRVLFSGPVFCGHLVERVAAAAPEKWDTSLTNVSQELVRVGRIRLLPPASPTTSAG